MSSKEKYITCIWGNSLKSPKRIGWVLSSLDTIGIIILKKRMQRRSGAIKTFKWDWSNDNFHKTDQVREKLI